eukprot:Plantae.Rhodophyta-Palmaria_palmata.ctg25125.p1 GENE.Plantae.Rhodophyta-Palmaria_palmata.ctg25125~~Plantae.Rhodophyta-Palmaria_palmata.ctg25125.p1  ORF type:complete len:160 (-),score=15.73 Plantae.Rhodophyta-Palmaria_palmata.ctg25125:88-567(-)
MKMPSETVRFNVSGKRYEVTRSFLMMHKSTMLYTSWAKPWQKNTEIAFFRDGGRFRYCLEYLLEGHVVIPSGISKEDLILDLEYYKINFEKENIVSDCQILYFPEAFLYGANYCRIFSEPAAKVTVIVLPACSGTSFQSIGVRNGLRPDQDVVPYSLFA